MNKRDDNIYIDKVLQGDTTAFACLVDRYKDMVFTIACRIVKNREDAEEIAQDAFMKAYGHLENFKGGSRFSTWLYSIVYNTAVSRTRKKQLETYSIDEAVTETFSPEDSVNQLNMLGNEDQKKFIKEAINRLPGDDASILTLYYMDECSFSQLCEITGLENSNIKIKLHRARKKLHIELQQLLKHELKEIL
ncbi:MAG: sigma-70 family RNA polymerase sigma factor [Bacteroidota bacterium]